MAPASLHNQHEAAHGEPGAMPNTPATRAGLVLTPGPAQAVPSSDRPSDHKLPKTRTVLVSDQIPPLLVSSIPLQPTTPP
jgi:hypothetical protein